ncbi:rhombosortase [Panacagrimonas perspica]|nr:rhombosortase [Panacagrimonas perspica]
MIALVATILEGFGDSARRLLSFDRAGLASWEWWRLLTGHFVHLGGYHLGLNLLGLLALQVLCPKPVRAREWVLRVIWLALFVSIALYAAAPTVGNYVGFSGVLHGLFVLGLVPMAREGDRIALVCLLYLIGKIVWEQVMGAPVSDEHAIGGHVVTLAHLFGTLAALVYGFAFGTFRTGVKTQ